MPFLHRVIEPQHLSRTALWDEGGKPRVTDSELEAVVNNTLSNALRQLASLVLVANDIFAELGGQLAEINKRSEVLKKKIEYVDAKVAVFDPKTVTVPEGDICSFALIKDHYVGKQKMDSELFSVATRPPSLQALYDAASKTPVSAMRQLDRWRHDGHRSSRFFLCTPVLGARRKKMKDNVDIDIETRMPAAVEDLRRWTSSEALGDVTVAPDCPNRITTNVTITDGDATDATLVSDDEAIDYKLPSPEEQLQVVALKFPAEIVAVDITGKSFDRMSLQRRSFLHGDITAQPDGDTIKRRTKTRRTRSKRRNTLAGTDQKEIQDALEAGETPSTSVNTDTTETTIVNVGRSRSSDILRISTKKESPEHKKSHFNTLKQWGKMRYDRFMNKSNDLKNSQKKDDIDEFNIYETVTMKRRRNIDKKTHQRNGSISSSEKSSINLPISSSLSGVMNIAVKLRESSLQRRERRSGDNKDEPHSSSGNWSASSESGRNSIGSEITSTTHPKSTTSAATSSNSLNTPAPNSVNSRRRFNVNISTASSITSEGTLTPDIIHDLHEDGETSSVYSCDTEGYYTSFHMDSGLKTLKEEELPITPLHSTSAFSTSSTNTAENEYELFGKGSTSTTTSSAGTVCTTLLAAESNKSLSCAPAVPERKSSLTKTGNKEQSPESSLERDFSSEKTGTVKRSPATTKAIVNIDDKRMNGDVSPDSGHNTSSSPIESISSPNGVRSGSEFEFSESSDMEGSERIERIRVKTTINSSRIPSMCVITPSQSDDEGSQSSQQSKTSSEAKSDEANYLGSKNIDRANLDLPLKQTHDNKILNYTHTKIPLPDSHKMQVINLNQQSGYVTLETINKDELDNASHFEINKNTSNLASNKSMRAASPSGGSVIIKEEVPVTKITQPVIKSPLFPLNNMLGRIKTNLSLKHKRENSKSPNRYTNVDEVLPDLGEYVTIADVKNNNDKTQINHVEETYSDIVNRNLKSVLSDKIRETEYVSLNDLPCSANKESAPSLSSNDSSLERKKRQGARVKLDAEGKVVYSSDSLKRRKGAHTTFEPGVFVKVSDGASQSPVPSHRVCKPVRPATNTADQRLMESNSSSAAQLGKVVIKASSGNSAITTPTSEVVRMPPATIVVPNSRPTSPKPINRGAYVHVQDSGSPLSPVQETERVKPPENSMYQSVTTFENSVLQAYTPRGTMRYQDPMCAENITPAGSYTPDQYYLNKGTQMYQTLPTRKAQYLYEPQPERSVTPDITRGLERNFRFNYGGSMDRRLPNRQFAMETGHSRQENLLDQKLGIPVAMPNIDYRYGYSSTGMSQANSNNFTPISTAPQTNQSNSFTYQEIEHDPIKISPIDPRNSGCFQSSTPSHKNPPPMKAAMNLENKLLSPKKSTMSNEELYAVIHKSKKKMNIIEDNNTKPVPAPAVEEALPKLERVKSPETGYFGNNKSKSRLSWSPTKGEYIDFNSDIDKLSPPNESRTRQSWAHNDRKGNHQTSRLDFKKLLLQKSNNILAGNTKKLSAVEQLKLSKQQVPQKPTQNEMSILELSGSPRSLVNRRFINNAPNLPRNLQEKSKPNSKLLSPRSQWRFNSPRSDVLSSTILEDCREDESPNSSAEKKKSPLRLENRFDQAMGQNLTAVQNQVLQIESDVKTVDNPQNISPISQRIQAQRARFFSSVLKSESSNIPSDQCEQEKKATLETAF